MKRMFRRRIRQVPGLNTTSTADISFMLLIFFLVASSMDVDKGIARQLPPADTKPEQKEAEVDRQDLLLLTITADNRLLADGEPLSPGQAGGRIERFIEERGAAHLIQVRPPPMTSISSCRTRWQSPIGTGATRCRGASSAGDMAG